MRKNKKKTARKERASNKKQTKRLENPGSYLDKNPTWKFDRVDFDHQEWNIEYCDVIESQLIRKLRDFESMTWSKIQKASGGRRRGTNNHFISFEDMSKETQDRAKDLKILEYEELFSSRLKGTERLFGILLDGVYSLVWYDLHHVICPSSKRKT